MKKNLKKLSAVFLASSMVLGNSAFTMAEEVTNEPVAMSFEAALSETGADLFSTMVGTDISWLKNFKIDARADLKEDMFEAVELVASLNDSPVLSAAGVVDFNTMIEYLRIFELSEEFLKVNLGEMIEELGGSFSMDEAGQNVMNAMSMISDEETQAALLEKYVFPFMTAIETANVKEAEVSYKDQSATLSYAGIKANLGTLADTLVEDLNTLKEDADTMAFLNAAASEGEVTPEVLDQAIEAIQNAKSENNFAAMDLEAMYGMNEEGSAYGGYLDIAVGDEIMKVADFVAFNTEAGLIGEAYIGSEEENFGAQFEIGEAYTAVFTANHAGIFQAVLTPEGTGAKVVITPITDYEEAPLADFEGFAIELFFEGADADGSASLKLIYNEDALVTLTGTVAPGEVLEMPDMAAVTGIDVNDEEAMNAYAESIDPTILIENLKAAGVPEEFFGEAEELVEEVTE